MTDTTIIEEEAAPAETPAQLPAGDSWGEVQGLLDEFEQKTATPEPDAPALPDAPQDGSSDLDALLRQLDGPSPDQQRIEQLTGEVGSLRAAEHRRAELEAFNSYADDLQKQVAAVAPHLPDDWARLRLENLAHDPLICAAFDFRNVDRSQANLELAKVQVTLGQLQRDPAADPAQINQLRQYGWQLEAAVNSHAILRKAINGILSDARKLAPPIDPIATADHDMIAQAVRDGTGPIDLPEAPVRWGSLSAKDGRERVLREFGFDPGWSH